MSELESQKELIHNKDWNVLVILDACRYDFFEKNYKDYLSGTLNRVTSPGYDTDTWTVRTFSDGDFRDVVYVSANARINGKGVEVIEDFNSDWFYKIIDVWEKGNYKITPPELVGRITRRARFEHPEKRIISHFTQPHSPFTSLGQGKRTLLYKIRNFVGKVTTSLIGHDRTRKVRKTLGMTNQNENRMEGLVERHGLEKIKRAYEADLRMTLEEVRVIADRVPGKTIVTADHGELLGEDELYGHGKNIPDSEKENPILLEVPWLEVEG